MARKAIIYTRVSTEEQKKQGYSLGEQRYRMAQYCLKNNIEIVAHYEDDYSAKTFKRPAIKKMLEDIRTKKVEANLFLCSRWDRYSRGYRDSLEFEDNLKKFGIDLKIVEWMELDPRIPENKLIEHLFRLWPEIENERRGINTKAGMRQANREGRWTAKPPKGYKLERIDNKSYLVPNEDSVFIYEIFTEFAKGIYSVEELRKIMINKGFNCSKTHFHNLLKHYAYIGKILIPEWFDEPEEIVNGLHDAIVPEEIFYRVQSIISERKPRKKPKSKHSDKLPLRGHLQCSICGKKLTGSPSRSKTGARHFYYHCRNDCKERFRADTANGEFLRYLKSFKIRDEVLVLYYKILEDVFNRDEVSRDKEVEKITKHINLFKNRIISVGNKYSDGEIDVQEFRRFESRFLEKIRELNNRIAELSMQDSNYLKYIKYSFSLLGDLEGYYKRANVEVKDKLVSSIFPEKLIYEEEKYRTPKVNAVLSLLTNNINELGEIKNKKAVKNDSLFALASPGGVEPPLQDRKS